MTTQQNQKKTPTKKKGKPFRAGPKLRMTGTVTRSEEKNIIGAKDRAFKPEKGKTK